MIVNFIIAYKVFNVEKKMQVNKTNLINICRKKIPATLKTLKTSMSFQALKTLTSVTFRGLQRTLKSLTFVSPWKKTS